MLIENSIICVGVEIGQLSVKSAVRTCVFSYSANMAVYSTDATYGLDCEICVIDVRNADDSFSKYQFFIMIIYKL